MSREKDRRGRVFGGAWSPATQQDDVRLDIDGIVNGEPTMLQVGDLETVVLRVLCSDTGCGEAVGHVTQVTPAAGGVPFYFATCRCVDRLHPIRTREARTLLEESKAAPVLFDCTTHGRLEADRSDLRTKAEKAARSRSSKKVVFGVRSLGRPVGDDLEPGGMTIDEFRQRWAAVIDRLGSAGDTPSGS